MKTYAWVVEDQLAIGTLEVYRNDWESTHYSGDSIGSNLWDGETFWHVNAIHEYKALDEKDGAPYAAYGRLLLINDAGEDGEEISYSINLDA